MKSRHVWIATCAIAFTLLLAYLLWADQLAIRLFRSPGDELPYAASPVEVQNSIHAHIDDIVHNPGSPLEKTEISGWAIPYDSGLLDRNPPLSIDLVFSSDQATFRASTLQHGHLEIPGLFGIEHTSYIAGFSTMLIPIRLPEGTYRLGICIHDGTEDVAFGWTNRQFIQGRNGFHAVHFTPTLTAFSPMPPFGELQAHTFDTLINEKTKCTLTGWAWSDTDNDAFYQEVLLVFSGDPGSFALSTRKTSRPDLRRSFGSRMRVLGDFAGFSTVLPVADLPHGTYRLGIAVREEGNVVGFRWMGKEYTVDIDALRPVSTTQH